MNEQTYTKMVEATNRGTEMVELTNRQKNLLSRTSAVIFHCQVPDQSPAARRLYLQGLCDLVLQRPDNGTRDGIRTTFILDLNQQEASSSHHGMLDVMFGYSSICGSNRILHGTFSELPLGLVSRLLCSELWSGKGKQMLQSLSNRTLKEESRLGR